MDDILFASQELEQRRRAANGSAKGRKQQREVDLLRAALVFSSAGIDACMTRLVIDAGSALIRSPQTGAHKQYREFLKQAIPAKSVDAGLRETILNMNIDEGILTHYLNTKAKASYQGSQDLQKRVVQVLGLPASTLCRETESRLDEFFKARNEIVHQMDFLNRTGTSKARRHRKVSDVEELCYFALNSAAELINATISTLLGEGLR